MHKEIKLHKNKTKKIPAFLSLGIDLVQISKFRNITKEVMEKTFHPDELKVRQPESLAGAFAAKEAFFKALKKKGDWLDVLIGHKESGAPFITSPLLNDNQSVELSISHDGDYVVATVIINSI